MKNSFLIILFIPFFIFSQNFEKLKNSDTIYFSFKNLKCQKKIFQENKNNKHVGEYYYTYLNNDKKQYLIFTFNYSDSISKLEKKSFLKNNKNYVIDGKFLRKYNLNEINELFKNKKYIYLIDSKEINNSKIKLKKVVFQSSSFFEM